MVRTLNIIRYLSFEINRECPNAFKHAGKCPIAHPERYAYSCSLLELTDEVILDLYAFCLRNGFRGIVMWHMYNEPVLVINRIRMLMDIMVQIVPNQAFQLTTSIPGDYSDFAIVKFSDYEHGAELDNRVATAEGVGKPYSQMPKSGACGRGLGWEIPIDNFGNWCLCCNDWRCEGSFGSIMTHNWDELLERYYSLREHIRWNDEKTYNALPRMCRACLDKNPSLSKRGGI
jgi:hypothetical protein